MLSDLIKRSDVLAALEKVFDRNGMSYGSDKTGFAKEVPNAIEALPAFYKMDEWILCSERVPENELDVEITYIREHYLTGEKLYLTARAFYEDGTYTTEDSAYSWDEADDWEYDEITESYKIPEGWFESVSFAERFEAVDMPVIAWRPIAKPYKP